MNTIQVCKRFITWAMGCAVAVVFAGCAAAPSQRVSYARHPNLAEAQSYIERAIDKVGDAQRANDFDLNGHAARAKVLLEQAYAEIKLAAEAANAR
jgi:hypothetical protein